MLGPRIFETKFEKRVVDVCGQRHALCLQSEKRAVGWALPAEGSFGSHRFGHSLASFR